jgi:hypothetical protein
MIRRCNVVRLSLFIRPYVFQPFFRVRDLAQEFFQFFAAVLITVRAIDDFFLLTAFPDLAHTAVSDMHPVGRYTAVAVDIFGFEFMLELL